MRTILVTYHSQTGRTRALAERVAEGARSVEGTRCLVKPAGEVTEEDFLAADGLVAGSPVYFGTMAAELKALFDRMIVLRKKIGPKVGAAFATSNHPSGGKETTLISILQAMLIYGMIVAGDPMETGGHYGVACSGPPDEDALRSAERLGRRIALLAGTLTAGTT
jgi:NAD(P)H dehydrogenase (quinone)